jgi:hypothetical protein
MLASLQCGTLQGVAACHAIGERVWVRRHPSYDLDVGLVVGHAAGQGVDDDGGYWYVIRPSGQLVTD